jgi:hypothetical protein
VSGSIVDLTAALGIAALLGMLAAPLTTSTVDASRARQAAGFAASRMRLARQQAVTTSSATGLVFDFTGGRWTFRVCVDANGNGVRRSEITGGPDRCVEGPFDLAALFPGVRVAIDGTIRGPDGDPPSSDPVRFGSSDLASFSPTGSCSAGSLYLQSAKGTQFAVRVASGTARLRVLRYDPPSRLWREL